MQLPSTCKPSSGSCRPSGLRSQDLPRGNFHAVPSPTLSKPWAGFLAARTERIELTPRAQRRAPRTVGTSGTAEGTGGSAGSPSSPGVLRAGGRQLPRPFLPLYKYFSPPRARSFPAPAAPGPEHVPQEGGAAIGRWRKLELGDYGGCNRPAGFSATWNLYPQLQTLGGYWGRENPGVHGARPLWAQQTGRARDPRRTEGCSSPPTLGTAVAWRLCLCSGVFLQKAGTSKGAQESLGGGNLSFMPGNRDQPRCTPWLKSSATGDPGSEFRVQKRISLILWSTDFFSLTVHSFICPSIRFTNSWAPRMCYY